MIYNLVKIDDMMKLFPKNTNYKTPKNPQSRRSLEDFLSGLKGGLLQSWHIKFTVIDLSPN